MHSYFNFKVIVLALVFSTCNSFPFSKNELEGGISSPILPEKILHHEKGTGPLSADILKQNPRLEYIGAIEGASFYIERQLLTWYEAKSFCENLGMYMGILPSQAIRDFIYGRLPSSDGKVWTAGKTKFDIEWPSISWHVGSQTFPVSNPGNWFFSSAAPDALVFEVDGNSAYRNMLGIYSISGTKFYTLCYV